MYDFCLKDDGKMSEIFQQYQDFLDRWRAMKPATARRLRDCSSGTSASKKFRYCLKNEDCIFKEVQPSFRAEWYKSCTLSFKQRQKERENSSKQYIFHSYPIRRTSKRKQNVRIESQINKAKESFTFLRFSYQYQAGG